ncbi:MAG TPA: VOC family protein [Noviherbaspirillum sp.]|nr:VOC family protein [Noviherbaspirillum sp.]
MPVLALDHVNIRVAPELLETVLSFYLNVVGLREGFRPPFGSTGHWLYAGAHAVIHLSVLRPNESPPRPGGTVDHIAFHCRDLEATCARLHALGQPYRRTEVPHTRQHQLFLRDPAGNGVELNFDA